METLKPQSSAIAAGENLTEFSRSASYEAAGQQVAGSPHSTILLDGSLSPAENHGNQSPFNAVTQGDTTQNPIKTDDSKDGQPVQSVEPSYRLKRKRRLSSPASITHKVLSNMGDAFDDIRSHCHLLDDKIRLLERRLLVSDQENKELRQQNEDLRQTVEDMEQEIQDMEQENDELKAYKHLHPEVSEEHHGAAM